MLVPGGVAVVSSGDGRAFGGEAEGVDVCTGEVTIRRPGSRARAAPYAVFAGQRRGLHAVVNDHRPPARLVGLGR